MSAESNIAVDAIESASTDRADPYLVWAVATKWADLVYRPQESGTEGHPIPFLFERKKDVSWADFKKLMKELDPAAVILPASPKGRFATVWLKRAVPDDLASFHPKAVKVAERYNLCSPSRMQRPPPGIRVAEDEPERAKLRGDILIGVIDSGCPFAHAGLLRWKDKTPSTRIAALWDMRHRSLGDGQLGHDSPMGYGRELLRQGESGLDAWLGQHVHGPRAIDEVAAYLGLMQRSRQADELRRHASHGAHVLDALVGPVPHANRVYADPDTPPTWAPAGDAASDADRSDLVFVQLPNNALQDNTGGWLGSHVLDAMQYILDQAGDETKHVVINLSYGGTVGPHDGSSMLERAIDELVDLSNQSGVAKLHVVVAAGNAFDSRGHAVLGEAHFHDEPTQGGSELVSTPLVWRILPETEAPSFMEMWLPESWLKRKPKLRVWPPGAPAFEVALDKIVCWPTVDVVQATVIFLRNVGRGDGRSMALLAISPTSIEEKMDRRPAPHGDWTVQVLLKPGGTLKEELHAYIARNDRDLGTLRRGRPSSFVDERDEPSRYLRAAVDDPGMFDAAEIDVPGDRQGATIRRRGTLSAVSTGKMSEVAAGYRLRSGDHAPYSSAGPARDPLTRVPTASLATDVSATLPGVRAGGNFSGVTFRLVGTSAAAPQLARKIVNQLAPPPPNPPPSPPSPPPNQIRPPQPLPGRKAPEDVFGEQGLDSRLPLGTHRPTS